MMAVTIDGSTPAVVSASALSVQSASFTPPAGSLVVALCALGNGSGAGTLNNGAVTDTLSGSWKLLKRENPTAPTAEVFCRDGTGSAMQVTYTSGQNDVLLKVLVLTGALASASQPGATALVNSTAYSVAITVTTAGSLIVGTLARATDAQALTVNGVTTSLGSFNGFAGDTTGAFRLTANGTPGAVTVGYSNTAAATNSLVAVEVMPTAGGTPVSLAQTGSASDTFSVAWSGPLAETGSASDTLVVARSGFLAETGSVSDTLTVSVMTTIGGGYVGGYRTGYVGNTYASLAQTGSASDTLSVSTTTTLGGGGYVGGYLTGYVQAGVIALDGAATTANTGASQTATQLGIVMPVCVSGSVVIIGGSLRVNGATSGAAICTPPGTVIERGHLQRDATPPAELFVWTWVSNGTTPTHTFAFTGPAGSTGYAIGLVAQGYAGVEIATPIDSLTLLAEVASASPHTTPAVVAPASTGWALALFADRNSSSWIPTAPLIERADTAGGVNCASVELCDSAGTVTVGSHSYVSTGTAATTAAVMALGYLHQFTGSVVAIPQSDNGQCGESLLVATVTPLSDAGIVADTLTVTLGLSDAGIGATTCAVNVAVSLSDIASVSDTLNVAVLNLLNETALAFDTLGIAALNLLVDVAAATDGFVVAASSSVGDAGAVATTVAVSAATSLTDASIAIDSFAAGVAVLVSDTSLGADSLSVAVMGTPILVEVGVASDTFSIDSRLLSDSALASNAFNANASTQLSETVSVSDTFNIVASNLLGDVALVADAINVIASNLLNDNASVSDVLNVAATRSFSESALVSDVLNALAPNSLSDSATSADTFTVTVVVLLSATASSSDTMQVAGVIRMLPQGIGVTVMLGSGLGNIRTVASGMTSTVVQAGNGQSGAAPQGNRGNSSAVVQ